MLQYQVKRYLVLIGGYISVLRQQSYVVNIWLNLSAISTGLFWTGPSLQRKKNPLKSE